ncbi:MAG: GNAT family N-acetyltransferase, partial [Desulfovibrio sp.]
IMGALLSRVRPDHKFMGNFFLNYIPDLRDRMILVDPFGSASSIKKNIRPLKESIRCLRDGGVLVVFPSGTVSHLHVRRRSVTDPRWSPTVAGIIRRTESPVLPVFFQGCNGPLFQFLGLMHPRLRTAMIPRELINKKSSTIEVSIGGLIPFKQISRLRKDHELMAYLRLRTYLLRKRQAEDRKRRFPLKLPLRPARKELQATAEASIIAPVPPQDLAKEIAALPPQALLVESGKYKVYSATAQEIPLMLREIGRAREFTFRLVGEGTGRELDLDRFDDYYVHLFIWNEERQELVGAYRLGSTRTIIPKYGIDGLYTSTLFSFKPALFNRMGPALEMGRSFVTPEYQKSFSALNLLWKGIGRYVLLNPDDKVLFGPVSVSSDYSSVSRELIVRYFKTYDCISEYSKLVKPRTPPKFKTLRRHEIREFRNLVSTVEDVTEVITDLEADFKGIPILLKQYLRLGGKILTFNVDPDFKNCLDGLIFVDLTQTEPKLLSHYMGKENTTNFREYHELKAAGQEDAALIIPDADDRDDGRDDNRDDDNSSAPQAAKQTTDG